MVNVNKNLIDKIIKDLAKLEGQGAVILRTYKGDRGLKIIKIDAEKCKIIEDGYINREDEIEVKELKRWLEKLIDREFPRSNKAKYKIC